MKKYNGLLMALFISFFGALVASEKSKKQPFFDKSTQQALKDTVFVYTLSYTFFHSAATGTGLILGVAATDFDRFIAKKNKENFSVIKSLRQEIPKMVSFLNKGVVRTHVVAVPITTGFAYNQYKKYKSYK